MKWTIQAFDAEGQMVERGLAKVDPGTPQVELFARMGEVYHGCPAPDSIAKIVVTDAADGLIREWERGGAELPKPEEAKEQPKAKTKAPKAVTNGATKPKMARGGGKKGPGVIDTIVAAFSRPQGANIEEIVAILVKTFPDREEKGMTSTARIQVKRKGAIGIKDEKRGMVYYKEAPPAKPEKSAKAKPEKPAKKKAAA